MKTKFRSSVLFVAVCGTLMIALSAAYGQSFLTNGLIAFFPFNGNANDMAGTNNGTPVGAILTTNRFGQTNSAYYFNGSSWIETPQYRLLDGASNATISAWIVVQSGTAGEVLSASDARGGYDPINFSFGVQSTADLYLQNCLLGNGLNAQIGSKGSPHPLTNLTANTWHQVIAVFSTSNPLGTLTIYVDGVTNYFQIASDDGVTAFTKITYDTNMRFLIGALEARPTFSTPQAFWSGNIDDIRIYNRALAYNEVQQLYNYESTPPVAAYTALELDYFALSGQSYQIQSSGNLSNWFNVGSPITGSNETIQQFFSTRGTNSQFYRLENVTP